MILTLRVSKRIPLDEIRGAVLRMHLKTASVDSRTNAPEQAPHPASP
jgi:hypothetical protein